MTVVRPPTATIVTGAALTALAALASFVYTSDADVYWHMATAREALATHGLVPRDPFSFSVAGVPWHHKDLLAECVLYLGFAKLGYAWFFALKFSAVVAVTGFLATSVPKPRRSAMVVVVVAGLAVQSFLFIEQPALFSLVLFAATMALEERASARPGPRILARWVGLNVLWTWLHRFSLLGHGMLVLWAMLLTLERRGSARARRWAWIAAIASPAIALANPSGVHALASGSTMAAHPELRQQFFEWKRVGPGEMWGAFPVAMVLVGAAAVWAVASTAATRRRGAPGVVRTWHLAVLIGLAAMTFDSIRWMPYLALTALAIFARLFAEALVVVPPARQAVLLPALALALVGWCGFARRNVPYAIGEDPAWSPRGAVAFARAHGLSGPVANTFDLGGYLIWSDPAAKVLVDGRNELVYAPAFVVRCVRAEHDPATFYAMRAEDGVSWALAVDTPGHEGYAFLADDPRWTMVYWSETAAVYVRLDAHQELVAAGFRFVDPRSPTLSVYTAIRRMRAVPAAMDAIGVEVQRMLDASPDSVRALMTAAVYEDALGPSRRPERDAVLGRLERLAGDLPAVGDFVNAMHAAR
jgi:hypothetical protein